MRADYVAYLAAALLAAGWATVAYLSRPGKGTGLADTPDRRRAIIAAEQDQRWKDGFVS